MLGKTVDKVLSGRIVQWHTMRETAWMQRFRCAKMGCMHNNADRAAIMLQVHQVVL